MKKYLAPVIAAFAAAALALPGFAQTTTSPDAKTDAKKTEKKKPSDASGSGSTTEKKSDTATTPAAPAGSSAGSTSGTPSAPSGADKAK